MKIAFKHLVSFFNQHPSIGEVSDKLFQLGHEHEIINNKIFDLELTPNRGDCFSVLGLARDLGSFYEFNDNLPLYKESIDELQIEFENKSEALCPKISFLEIEIEKIPEEYDEDLSLYFRDLGINRNNFFTDISNYISYEMGQPTHCFDRSKVNKKLVFEEKECDEDFSTLLDSKIKLQGRNGVFLLDKDIISLAGIMGGKSTSCTPKTKQVLVECAFFEPELVIGKSIKYNLNSDSAHKFERGVDPSIQEKVLRRFIKLVSDHAKINKLRMISYGSNEQTRIIEKDFDKINSVLGTNFTEGKIKETLEKIGFVVGETIQIPHHRHDINSQNDLAEEVARVVGYDNLPSSQIDISSAKLISEDPSLLSIREGLLKHGFSEVINFPFVSLEEEFSVSIDNPLDSNKCFMRTNLKSSLLENLLYNERRQKDSIKLFEFSKIYSNQDEQNDIYKIGIIASGRRGHNYLDFSKNIDKKYLDEIFSCYFDPENIIELSRDDLDTKNKSKIFYIEIELKDISAFQESDLSFSFKDADFPKYIPISEYPSSIRDISFLIEEKNSDALVFDQLEITRNPNLKKSFIFDHYFNKDSGVLKIGCRFVFQSNQKTLSDQDISESMQNILKPFLDIDGVSVPGME